MDHSKYFDKVKNYYDKGLWGVNKLREAVVKGWITEEEYMEIIGDEDAK
jgi:hypothetical protein